MQLIGGGNVYSSWELREISRNNCKTFGPKTRGTLSGGSGLGILKLDLSNPCSHLLLGLVSWPCSLLTRKLVLGPESPVLPLGPKPPVLSMGRPLWFLTDLSISVIQSLIFSVHWLLKAQPGELGNNLTNQVQTVMSSFSPVVSSLDSYLRLPEPFW